MCFVMMAALLHPARLGAVTTSSSDRVAVIVVLPQAEGDSTQAVPCGLMATVLIDSSNTWVYPAVAVPAVLMFALIYEGDQGSYRFLFRAKERSPLLSTMSRVVTMTGDGMFSLGVFVPVWLAGVISGDQQVRRAGRVGFQSFLLTGITVQVLKHLFSRERPSDATMPGGRFHGPFAYFTQKGPNHRSLAAYDAFPSGHTATIFSVAETFNLVFDTPWLPYVTYSFASLVAVSRITERTHWISDCVAGAAIGVALTRLIDAWDRENAPVAVQPYSSLDIQGLSLVVRF